MFKKIGRCVLVVVCMAGLMGCDAGLIMGSKAMGVRSGEFVYTDGYVVALYKDNLDRVWQAAEAVMKDLKAYDIVKDKKIAKGSIVCLVSEEKVTIKVEFMEREKISVAILVGMGGSKLGARSIHEKITQKLMNR